MQAKPKSLQAELFKTPISKIIDTTHPLCVLGAKINWPEFDKTFGALYSEGKGRPAIPTRLMVGLHYLKHTYNLSDEEVVSRWLENPYWQYFCGNDYFEHDFPIDASSMTRWRKRVSEAGMEKLLGETITAGLDMKVLQKGSMNKLNVDTTVQEKAISFPTDAKLYHRMREKLVELSKEHGVTLRQSYKYKSKYAYYWKGRYASCRQMKRANKQQKSLKTYLGRVIRDIERKVVGSEKLQSVFSEPLSLARRILNQKRQDKNKVYSIHAPEVECISKGKVHKKYEFGCKVSVVATSKECFIMGMKAYHGNPYDGHTLDDAVLQAESITGFKAKEIYVDRGYRGHNYRGDAEVRIAGRGRKRLRASVRKWLKRRSAIEAVIGHTKTDGRLGRNYLLGREGDEINAILSGCGYNIRKLLKALLFCLFFCRKKSLSTA
ncbi:MAG: IS5 family transposase [Deltaproteobacteria bacterium]|nr:IS5 family transposase [Deltaproteobacteria bacterium]